MTITLAIPSSAVILYRVRPPTVCGAKAFDPVPAL